MLDVRLRPKVGRLDPVDLSYDALTYLAADQERISRFLMISGFTPDTIRPELGKPHFVAGLLDYVVADDRLVIGLAESVGSTPEAIYQAREVASPRSEFG